MIKNKKFYKRESLNEFIEKEKVKVISIETLSEKYDTGLPIPGVGTFITYRQYYNLWYQEFNETKQNMKIETRQNFISVDGKTVMNSYGEFFTVGELVKHEDTEAGTATIISFEPNIGKNEIRVNTDKGYAHIDFLVKVK